MKSWSGKPSKWRRSPEPQPQIPGRPELRLSQPGRGDARRPLAHALYPEPCRRARPGSVGHRHAAGFLPDADGFGHRLATAARGSVRHRPRHGQFARWRTGPNHGPIRAHRAAADAGGGLRRAAGLAGSGGALAGTAATAALGNDRVRSVLPAAHFRRNAGRPPGFGFPGLRAIRLLGGQRRHYAPFPESRMGLKRARRRLGSAADHPRRQLLSAPESPLPGRAPRNAAQAGTWRDPHLLPPRNLVERRARSPRHSSPEATCS